MKRKTKLLCTLILCFSIVFCSSFVSFADGVEDNTSLMTSFDLPSEYSSSYPYMSWDVLRGYAQSNGLPYDIQGDYLNALFYNINDIQSRNSFSSLKTFTTFITQANTTIDVSNLPIAVLSSVGGSNYADYLRFSGSGKIAVVNNYFVSDSPFTIYAYNTRNNDYSIFSADTFRYRSFDVDTADSNGLYKITVYNNNNFYNNNCMIFTNLPIYLSTTSGASGFTSSGYPDIANFTFLADNINYNYLLYDDIVFDPQAPIIPDDPWWDDAKHFLNFKVSSLFGWDPVGKKLTHNMTFNWNQDMMLNPDFYVLNLSYRIVYQDENMTNPDEFYWVSDQHEFRRNLMDIANPILNSKYFMSLDFSDFVNDQNETFLAYYLNTIHSVTGTYVQNININSSFEDWVTTLNNYLNVFNSIEEVTYKMTKVRQEIATQITTFKIYSYVSVGRVADPNANSGVIIGNNPGNTEQDFRSGINVSTYNCLTAKNTIESNDNVNNLYPSEDNQLPSVITPDTVSPGNNISGGNFAQGGQGGNATVNINTDPMGMWSPEIINSIKDTFDFIQNQLSEYQDNNFMGFMVESYKIIPKAFWDMIILAGGVITGFAVIRFIRNK